MRSRLCALAVVAVLVAAGCGDSEDPEDTGAPDGNSDVADDGGNGGDDAGSEGGSEGGENGRAVVTVGDETFEFEWTAGAVQRCDTDFFGGFWALAATTTDMPSLEAELWPEGTGEDRASRIQVETADDTTWSADPDSVYAETVEDWPAGVDTLDIDGNTATGTATFVNHTFGDEPEGVSGTFQITCE